MSNVVDLTARLPDGPHYWTCPKCGNAWLRLGGAVVVEGRGRIVGWQGTVVCPDHPDEVIGGGHHEPA